MIRARIAVWLMWLSLVASIKPVNGQGLPRARPEEVGMSTERLGRLDAAFREYTDEGRLPGAVVLVARRGHTAFLEVFGSLDLESGAPMQEDAIFRIASQTKAAVSVAVMTLQEEGRLLITDPSAGTCPSS
jgi:CubicO group peptidase (beta-lactamase class C family)